MMRKAVPRYVHDCPKCGFRGTFGSFDIYVCRRHDQKYDDLIARRSSEPSDYASFPRFVFAKVVSEHLNREVGGFPEDAEEHVLADWMLAILNTVFKAEGQS